KSLAPALTARTRLGALAVQRRATADRDFLLGTLRPGTTSPTKALWMAVNVARIAEAKQQPDLDRDPELRERELPRLLERLEREQRSVSLPAERQILAWFVERGQALPKQSRILAFDQTFRATSSEAARLKTIDALLAGTKVLDPAERQAMLTETPAQLAARKD